MLTPKEMTAQLLLPILMLHCTNCTVLYVSTMVKLYGQLNSDSDLVCFIIIVMKNKFN